MRVLQGVNVAFAVAVLCGIGCGQERLTGLVRGVDRRPAANAVVSLHSRATAGVVGLRSDAETIRTWRTTTDGNGRFRLSLPAGCAGSLIVDGDDGLAVVATAVAGSLIAVDLQPHRRQQLRLRGLGERQVTVLFEGPATLPPQTLRLDADGTVEVERLPAHETLILAPAGWVEARTGLPWAAVGEGGELTFVTAPSHQNSCTWAGLQDLTLAHGSEAWGGEAVLWIGQDGTGRPWVGDGAGGTSVQPGVRRVELAATVPANALLLHCATVVHAGTGHLFTVVRRSTDAGDSRAWVGVPSDEPFLTVAGDGDERVIGPGGGSVPARLDWPLASAALTGVVLGDDHLPVAGASISVRPSAAVPTRAGSILIGVTTATSASGRFRLPHRFVDGGYCVVVAAPDGRWWVGEMTVSSGASEPLHVQLASGASIRGSVVDAHGDAVAGVPVWVWSGREPLALASVGAGQRTFTGEDGRFEIAGLRADLSYELGCDTRARGHVTVDGVRPGSESVPLPLAASPPR